MDYELKANLTKTYDRYAKERDQSPLQAWKLEEREYFLKMLQKEAKKTILEIGAGPGRDGKFFQDNGLRVICTDISPEMVKLCREKELRAYVMDFYKLKFLNESYDAIWALNCLLHASKTCLKTVLQKIYAILKKDGLFYLGVYGGEDSEVVWDDDYYEPPRFFSFYTDDHLKEVVTEYFDLIYFKSMPVEGKLHFQSLILRK